MLGDKIPRNQEGLSLLFVVAFSLISLTWNGNFLVRGIASFQTVGDFFSGSLDGFGSFFKSGFNKLESFEKVQMERDSCLNVMDDYRTLPQDLERLKQENAQLRTQLGFPLREDYRTITAEVLSVRLNSIYRTILINKGSESGIGIYMPVVARTLNDKGQFIEALVGKTIAVKEGSAVIQPLINSNFSMGVSMPGTNLWASMSGNSGRSNEAFLEYIDSGIIIDPRSFGAFPSGPNPPIVSESNIISESYSKIGKSVVSSGGSGVFTSGIPVGIITEEGSRSGAFKTAYIRPFIEFDKLQFVTVILKGPEKWAEKWPEERSIQIENPYFGELDYPKEEEEKRKEELKKTKKVGSTPSGGGSTSNTSSGLGSGGSSTPPRNNANSGDSGASP